MARDTSGLKLVLIGVVIVLTIVGIIVGISYDIKSTEGFAGENTTDPDFIVGSSNFTIDANISKTSVFPIGTIISWHGDINKKPIGWLLCDGTKGTPDLRGRTVIGSGNYEAKLPDSMGGGTEKYLFNYGDKGGEMSHTLTIEEMPSHSHESYSPAGSYSLSGDPRGHHHGAWMKTSVEGGSKSHNNMQPYVALHYLKFDPDNAN